MHKHFSRIVDVQPSSHLWPQRQSRASICETGQCLLQVRLSSSNNLTALVGYRVCEQNDRIKSEEWSQLHGQVLTSSAVRLLSRCSCPEYCAKEEHYLLYQQSSVPSSYHKHQQERRSRHKVLQGRLCPKYDQTVWYTSIVRRRY